MSLTFHLFFKHWSHYPPIWRSPSDYQSFIYFRAVSHKKKSILKCHLSPFSAAPFIGASLLGVAGDTSFLFFVEGSVTPVTHRYCEKNGYLFLLPTVICFFLDKKSNPFLPAFHFLFVILHPEKKIVFKG